MGYAIRKDGAGWRSVDTPADMTEDEKYSDTEPFFSPPPPSRKQVEELRLRAYADPITGSDRHFAEAVRLEAMGGTTTEIEAARSAGADRYSEIQAANPWPEV